MAEDDFHVVDDEPGDEDGGGEDEAAPGREAEFDDARIRRLSGERRAIFRQRSYCIVLTGFCVVAMFELIWSAAREVRHVGWDPKARLFAGGALFAVVGGIYIARQAMKLHRQTKYPLLIDPTEAPDFSPLADGSERWKKLEDM